ncbi:MAG: hypothetical protein EA379_05135 [Phycisphaerales bacterium]|nr:MAG: hypothetical protein EA379_05135 [Phycisphaerales bacterium]
MEGAAMAEQGQSRRSAGTLGDTPRSLTFFLAPGERVRALRALRGLHDDRAEALRIALGLREGGRDGEGGAARDAGGDAGAAG